MVRIKERYLLVNILYPPTTPKDHAGPGVPDFVLLHQPTTDRLTAGSLMRGLQAEIADLFGDYGSGATGATNLSVKYLSNATSTFILKIKRAHYRLVWAALTSMSVVPVKTGQARPCVFKVVRVSGTIRKAEEEAIRQARQLVLAAKMAQTTGQAGASSMAVTLPSLDDAYDVAADALMLDIDNTSEDDSDDTDGS
ncbi:Rpp14/Pop5 family protein [Plectosphaerella plurivora]|uniref:Ribonuclease P/MRP protein subunit POP5 n=1 Tax=Plectosphaerella plurivora TaxID=936078 RepID=A0A9P9A7H5_9PEZI|nr:Rpp14/Pop5 family protein [Plectosphaerella plurivora]